MSDVQPRDPGLHVLSDEPLNAETRLSAQRGPLTPNARFYVRCHFALPAPPSRLAVDGSVAQSLSLSLDEIRALPRRTLAVTLECAGNGRASLDPPVEGEQWGFGAVSTAEWTGTPLAGVLERARPKRGSREVLFRGADEGTPRDLGRRIAYERSLPLAHALHEDTLLAYEMNGEALPAEHGAPLRLVVPGWYGMASVKWLARVSVTTRQFQGFYQRSRYVVGRRPLRAIEPRAIISWPQDGEVVVRGRHRVRGYAWSGGGPPVTVELSVDAGATWDRAELTGPATPYAWREWHHDWEAREPGAVTLAARTWDATGATQPAVPKWNELGYANNAVQRVKVRVG